MLFLGIACLTFALSECFKNAAFGISAFVFLLLAILVILISAIYQFIKRKWLAGIFSLALFGGTILALVAYAIAMFFIDQERPDTFADNLKIPTNIPINIPLDLGPEEKRPDSIPNRPVTKTDFQLYNSFQPGLYEYDFWTAKIDSGKIYLKAFEVTQNDQLSPNELEERSGVAIYNPTTTIRKYGTTTQFTIYEGDWGKPYAVRFEVWFKPANGGKERKLLSKNYKIEGWMR
jgi:hypothetical protein